jgi:type II secretory ATPase GspE/PulE/Tfp pilus assembly ATPase PilB-like protein
MEDLYTQGMEFHKGIGCPSCGGVGYRGRTGIYEVLLLTDNMKDLIANEAPETALRQAALSQGTKSLIQAGMEKVLQGLTSMEELLRVTCTDQALGDELPGPAESHLKGLRSASGGIG